MEAEWSPLCLPLVWGHSLSPPPEVSMHLYFLHLYSSLCLLTWLANFYALTQVVQIMYEIPLHKAQLKDESKYYLFPQALLFCCIFFQCGVCTYLSDVSLWSAFSSFFMNRYDSWFMNNVVKWCPLIYFWRCLCIYFYSLFNKLHSNMIHLCYCLLCLHGILRNINMIRWQE